MSIDPIIRVEVISKKFCRSLKQTMLYGARDVARDLLGISQQSNELRPDEFWALQNISFTVKRGECLGLIGPNGAGKSTLLKLLNGITLPDTGMIKVAGRVGALLELGAGFHPMLTGRENIYLNAAILGLTKEEISDKFDAIVGFAGLEEFIDSPVKHYSSGMYVRLGFAIAAHAEPDILLIDEALAVGDVLFQAKCFAKLREFKENGMTIIFVTHSLDLITSQCNRAILICKGTKVGDGMSKDVVDQYNRLMSQRCETTNVRRESREVKVTLLPSSKEIEWSHLFRVNPNEDRYGSRKAEILEAGIFTGDNTANQVLERNRESLIKIKVRHNESMPAAIVAYTIKDLNGVILCGTNTLFQSIDMGWMERGDAVVVTFRQIMRLNPGNFLLCVGSANYEDGEYVIYDRRFDYLTFEVVSAEQRVGIFDSDAAIEWTRTV
jgi:teichoic acid transport system ATP-binding protein